MKYMSIALTALIFLAGCATNGTQTAVKEVPKVVKKEKVAVPPKPKKEHELKEVEDTNFSDAYMYPEGSTKKAPVTKVAAAPVIATSGAMNKAQCIAMISQEKFDKYAAMFGSEAASIKRCQMIKATQQ
jgi:predicted nucleotidyltransferase